MTALFRFAWLASLFVLAAACGSTDEVSSAFGGPGGAGAGDFGATQGGIQDMSFARDTIAAGRVPPPEAFVVEAMFSEHDLPLDGDPCHSLFCLRAANGLAPSGRDEPSAWVQVGMSSTIDPDTFKRPSLSVVAVVDVSGSRGWDYGVSGNPGGLAKALLARIAAELGENDRISIVTYGSSSRVYLAPVPAIERERILDAIEALQSGGSTNMEDGMKVGYEVASGEAGRAEQVRLMLFTDVQPNVGLTGASEFERLARAGADSGAGLTVFALGLGLNPDVLRGMSQIRNANAFSLTEPEDVPSLIEDSWPWMASPIAHELVLRVTASEGFSVAEGYGFPESTVDGASMSVSSVFLSRRRGALLLRIEAEAESEPSFDALTVDLTLEYETLDAQVRSEAFTKGFSALSDEAPFEQASVHKTVALARLVSAMKEAAEIYRTDQDGAVAVQQRAHTQFEDALMDLDDDALEPERELSAALLSLMRTGASQESFYGGF